MLTAQANDKPLGVGGGGESEHSCPSGVGCDLGMHVASFTVTVKGQRELKHKKQSGDRHTAKPMLWILIFVNYS